jgi:hypothetical protein
MWKNDGRREEKGLASLNRLNLAPLAALCRGIVLFDYLYGALSTYKTNP